MNGIKIFILMCLLFFSNTVFSEAQIIETQPFTSGGVSDRKDYSARDFYQRGLRLIVRREWLMAETQLLKAIEKDPSMGEAFVELGRVYCAMNRFDEARRSINVALKMNYRYNDALFVSALLYYRQYKTDRALTEIDKAIELQGEKSGYFALKGAILQRKKQYVPASEAFNEAVKKDPSNYDAMAAEAYCNYLSGKHDIAIEKINKAFEKEPNNFQIALVKGIILADEGNAQAAYQFFEKAASLNPDNFETYYNMGLLDLSENRRGRGEYHLLKAMDLDRSNPLPYYALGKLYRQEKRCEDAVRMLEIARDIDPENMDFHLELGLAYMIEGRYNEAQSSIEKAVLIFPESAVLRNALGSAYRAGGKFEEALREYNRALALDPNITIVLYNKANLFEDRGLIDEAVNCLKEYRSTLQDETEIEKTDRRIRILLESAKLKKEGK